MTGILARGGHEALAVILPSRLPDTRRPLNLRLAVLLAVTTYGPVWVERRGSLRILQLQILEKRLSAAYETHGRGSRIGLFVDVLGFCTNVPFSEVCAICPEVQENSALPL